MTVMDPDRLRAIAHQEVQQALARYVARVGDEDLGEWFAAALCDYLAEWFEGFTRPPTPTEAAKHELAWEERLARARRDLELRGEASGE
jgi:hypothetical protein